MSRKGTQEDAGGRKRTQEDAGGRSNTGNHGTRKKHDRRVARVQYDLTTTNCMKSY